jgi:hypothetical protein
MLGFELIAFQFLFFLFHLVYLQPLVIKFPINFSRSETNQAVNKSDLIINQLYEVLKADKYFIGARGSLPSGTTTDLNLL